MTVSTAGIVPRIHDLAQEEIRPKLAISLNASNDELRTRLMPMNQKVESGEADGGGAGVSACAIASG